MNKIWKIIKQYIKKIYMIYIAFIGFIYDFRRFIAYGGWRENFHDIEQRNYYSIMVYHGLEKSLSYKERKSNSGWNNAFKLLDLLKIANRSNKFGYHDIASKQVLEKFINLSENKNSTNSKKIREELEKYQFNSNEIHGAIEYDISQYNKGILDDPEAFFFSRYSLREFKNKIVDDKIISRAINLSMKTPSVCNRQAWHLYHTCDQEVKDSVLMYQGGNKPFGENIPNLIIVTTDLKAFFSGVEHYQHWIDGGLLSMSLMYAFHSLGVATCALNWSQSPKNDKLLRETVNIQPHHTIIMILAVGYPDEMNKVCASGRRPYQEIFTTLEKRK